MNPSRDIPPSPLSEHDLRQQWNAQADQYNQWDSLDSGEQLAWAQCRAIAADRAALAQPVAEGPTDEEIEAGFRCWWSERFGSPYFGAVPLVACIEWTQLALTAWGHTTPQSIPVSELLPGEGDCCGNPRNGEGQWCWGRVRPQTAAGTPVVWRLMRIDCLIEEAVEWMPWWALPLPVVPATEGAQP